MIESFKAQEPSNQSTKRGRKAWLIGLAVVVAAATIALLSTPPKPEPVRVWFVRATNEAGVKRLVFEGTNGGLGTIEYFACAVTGMISHAKTRKVTPEDLNSVATPVREDFGKAEVGWPFKMNVRAPATGVPFHVVWAFHDRGLDKTVWGRFRMGCERFFRTHHMPALAKPFKRRLEVHYIPSSEITE